MVARLPRGLARNVKRHQKLLKDLTKPSKRASALKRANKTMVGGSLFKTIKDLFKQVLNGKISLPKIMNSKARALLRKFVTTRNTDEVIRQNGSGIFSILAQVIPMVLPLVMSLFKNKKKKK